MYVLLPNPTGSNCPIRLCFIKVIIYYNLTFFPVAAKPQDANLKHDWFDKVGAAF